MRSRRIIKNIFQSVLFITVLFFSSCSNSKHENQNPKTEKQDSILPPTITILESLADSSKPKEIFLENTPKPLIISIPKVAETFYSIQTKNGPKKMVLSVPNITPLSVLKNKKGEVIKDKNGNPFILGEAGGASNFSNYTTDQGLALDAISSAIMDKKGNLWFGTYGGGVSRYDGKSFTNYTTAQGLAYNTVSSIKEDTKGNLWFGTTNAGVSRYDGKSFTNFTTAQGLANNSVMSILEDKTGNLWFGTDGGGLSRFDGKSFTNFTTAQGLANNVVWSMAEDKMGNLWFGTYGGGVSRYDGKSFTNFTAAQGLANNNIMSILEDKAGNLWFGTSGGGASRYDRSRLKNPCCNNKCKHDLRIPQDLKEHNNELTKFFTNFTIAQGLANNSVLCITEDKAGNLWFGTDEGGVSRYDGSFTNFTTAQGLPNNRVWTITEDKIGNLWFGTYGGGVSRYDGNAFTNFTTTQGLSNNNVRSITEDKMGNLWFGTYGGGVNRYDGKSFTSYTVAQGLQDNTILSITEDKTGNLWFGTDGAGVSRYDGSRVEAIEAALQRGEIVLPLTQQDLKKVNGKLVKSFTNYTTAQGLANNRVWCITEDKKGNIWFGTAGAGMSCYNGNRVEAIEAALQRGEIVPQQTLQDLKKINGKYVKSFTNFTSKQGLANNDVRSITEDKNGNLWFGTYGGGVSRYDGKSFTNFTTAQGLADNNIRCITEDKNGNLWFGTSGGGVSRYDGKSFLNFTTTQGLPDNSVIQIAITKEQNIALGTNFGLGMLVSFTSNLQVNGAPQNVPPQNNLSNDELKKYTPIIEIYNSANGYPIKDVNSGQKGMFADSKGIIWIATGADKTGLVRFDYTALHKNTEPPVVFIQNVKLNNENICWYNLADSKVEKTDSTIMPANITEEVTTLGKALSDTDRNRMRQKFKDVKFNGITKFYSAPENLVLPYKHNNVTFDFVAIETDKPYLVRYQYMLEGYDNDWSPITNATTAAFGNIYEGAYTFKLKAQSPLGVWSEPIKYKFTVLPPWWRTWWMYSAYGVTVIASVVLIVWWNGRRLREKATQLTEEVRKATFVIREEKEKVELANIEISEQKKIVEKKNEKITDSINYAQSIQQSILMEESEIQKYFTDLFIYFQPKDIVSGDFYWFSKIGDTIIIAAVDCTGHGVPGAFMSMIGNTLLNQIVIEKHITSPSEILRLLNLGVYETLHQYKKGALSNDGMDIALCSIDFKNNTLEYAGAHNPLYIVSDNQMEIIKADIHDIGGGNVTGIKNPIKKEFTSHVIPIKKGMSIYLFSDGYCDQFGGSDRRKFSTQKFKELLLSGQHLSMMKQKELIASAHSDWKGNTPQIDDILVMGIRF